MVKKAFTFEALPASYGDCLLLTFTTAKGPWRLLVDTGPDETYPSLRARLLQIPLNRQGRRRIDLFIVTHIDHDHIGGAALLLNDADIKLDFGDIWFNAPPGPKTRGVAEGEALAEFLGATARPLPWNLAWSGNSACTPAAANAVELQPKGGPTITLLSPGPEQLKKLWASWVSQLAKMDTKARGPEQVSAKRGPQDLDIETLAAKGTHVDSAVPNGSSIAILVEHRGASALLCGDAHPTVLAPALQVLMKRRGPLGPMPLDVFKVSHHGSKGNTTSALAGLIKAKHVVISTNNLYFNHPDPEAMARLVLASRGATLWFTYDTSRNRTWDAIGLKERYGYATRYATPQAPVAIALNEAAPPKDAAGATKVKARTRSTAAAQNPRSGSRPAVGKLDFVALYRLTSAPQLSFAQRGLPPELRRSLARCLGMTQSRVLEVLGIHARSSGGRADPRRVMTETQALRLLGLARLVGQVEAMVIESGSPAGFDTGRWLSKWLVKPLPALGGRAPVELMSSADGQLRVAGLVARMQSGAFA